MNKAPDFSLTNQDGETCTLADYTGKWLVLYFYPKDNTPGCTREACNFRDARELIATLGNAVVVGVSQDSVASHKKFAEKHHLEFALLSDPNHITAEAYGSWKPKKMMGREFLGMHRDTFIITPDGKIAKEYRGVNPQTHAAQIITDLKAIQRDY